ncbi:MAG: DegT/DnrJ/EryC1/StrS family aminotransferase [Deltaproteobacteria bacterium]|nr:DegT/DnrJ/EryC1/StrS family aminotransferase [Deltaproteobacteria bacterium]
MMIEIFKPFMGQAEIKAIGEVIRSGWIGLGPKTAEFENKFAKFCGVQYAIGVNSATSALDLAMRLLKIGHGDEVIVPTMTFVSTAHVVAYNLATPIFADIDPITMNIDFKDVLRKVSKRTKAIIPVHYSGRPVDMDQLKEIAVDIPLVEDCAHATGARYKEKSVGGLGNIGCFSFHAVKNLAMGDGGALTVNNEEWMERAKRLRWLGIDKGTWDRTEVDKSYWWQYFVDEIGLKCHMNDLQAAIGLVQLKKLSSMNNRRRKIVNLYFEGLKDIQEIELPLHDDEIFKSAWHIFHIKCLKRNDLSEFLREKGINTVYHQRKSRLLV